MCPVRRLGVDKETLLQVFLVLLFVVLAALVWSPVMSLMGPVS